MENTKNNENKKITKVPEFNLNNPIRLVSDYKNYYENNFGLRTSLVNSYLNFKSHFLEENPLPNQVMQGENDWYFLGNAHNDILNDTFGNVPFTEAELHAIVSKLENIKKNLNSKKIKFYLVIPPNKQTIYQEKLFFQLKQNTKRLEQLLNHLKSHTDLKIISPQKRLMSEKRNRLLYHKTDSHWNDYGAFLGYSETMNVIRKDFDVTPVLLSDYHETTTSLKGDIPPLINKNVIEKSVALERNNPSEIDTLSSVYTLQHYTNKDQNLKIIMHCDSFSDAWIPYFNESFKEAVYIRAYELDHALIERIQPDIIIFEIVERNLSSLIIK